MFVGCLYACIDTAMHYAAGHTKMGVCRIPIPEIQAMVACKYCIWLWLSVGRMNRSMVDGWIYSKPVRLLVCLFADSVDWKYGWPVVGLPIGSLFGLSVGRSNHPPDGIRPVCYPTNHRVTGHLYIHPTTADQPTKDTSTSDQCLNFHIGGSTYSRFRPAGWLR